MVLVTARQSASLYFHYMKAIQALLILLVTGFAVGDQLLCSQNAAGSPVQMYASSWNLSPLPHLIPTSTRSYAQELFSTGDIDTVRGRHDCVIHTRGVARGAGRVYFFQVRVSRDLLHITIYPPMDKIDCVCSPNSIIIKNNAILTS